MTATSSSVYPRFDLHERRRTLPLLRTMQERVLVCDGAMGTMIQNANLSVDDFEGNDGCNELLVRTRPDVIREIHAAYFAAGADCVETNTFGATRLVLNEFGLGHETYALNRTAAALAREVAQEFSTPERPRFVLGSVGPTTRLVSLGHITFDDLLANYEEQIGGLIDGGADGILIETCQDILQVKCATIAANRAAHKRNVEVPILVQVTIETTGTLLVGTDIAGALVVIESLPIDVIGLNCATGPDLMVEHVKHLGRHSTRLVSVQPNAGLPQNVDGRAVYHLTPAELARAHQRFAGEFGVSLVGGCCGTTPEHIAAIAAAVQGIVPGPRPTTFQPQLASLYGAVPLDQDSGPLLVGERTNANGSLKFKEMLLAGDFDGMAELAANRGVDIINMSIGGLPALNDGDNARSVLYNRIIADGVQLVISAGNSGNALNTIGDPSVATDVVSVGASISRETWKANYGSDVAFAKGMLTFSSGGPREDGGFKPEIVAPGVSLVSLRAPGSVVDAANPAARVADGYFRGTGTSMSAAVTAGAVAVLLASRPELTPDDVKALLTSTAYDVRGRGAGALDLAAALQAPVPEVAEAAAWSSFATAWRSGDAAATARAWSAPKLSRTAFEKVGKTIEKLC